jgi:hypothetical protein
VLAAVIATLADAAVSIVTLSTFNIDCLLVNDADLAAATEALHAAGYTFIDVATP